MKLSILVFLASISMSLSSQTNSIGHTSIRLTDAARNNRKIPLEVFYPSLKSGDGTDVIQNQEKSYPLVIIAHGYLMKPDSYQYLWEALVPEGFIVLLPSTETGMFPSHKDYSEDIRYISKNFHQLFNDSLSIYYRCIDTPIALVGHSMGGGCSILATENNPSVNGLVTLAAYDTKPSAISAAEKITIPTLIFSGNFDRITKPSKHQVPMYNNFPAQEKTFISILGGGHCQMAMRDAHCMFGQFLLLKKPEISMDSQHQLVLKYLLPWLKYYLCNDWNSGRDFDMNIPNDPAIDFRRESTLIPH